MAISGEPISINLAQSEKNEKNVLGMIGFPPFKRIHKRLSRCRRLAKVPINK
jgi:hypothetical protein